MHFLMKYGVLSIIYKRLIFFNKLTMSKISLSYKFMLNFYVRHHGIALSLHFDYCFWFTGFNVGLDLKRHYSRRSGDAPSQCLSTTEERTVTWTLLNNFDFGSTCARLSKISEIKLYVLTLLIDRFNIR